MVRDRGGGNLLLAICVETNACGEECLPNTNTNADAYLVCGLYAFLTNAIALFKNLVSVCHVVEGTLIYSLLRSAVFYMGSLLLILTCDVKLSNGQTHSSHKRHLLLKFEIYVAGGTWLNQCQCLQA